MFARGRFQLVWEVIKSVRLAFVIRIAIFFGAIFKQNENNVFDFILHEGQSALRRA